MLEFLLKFRKNKDFTYRSLRKKLLKNHFRLQGCRAKNRDLIIGAESNAKTLQKLTQEKEQLEKRLIALMGNKYLYLGLSIDMSQIMHGLNPHLVEWGDISNHALVLGTTRMGKTKLMLNIIYQNIMRGDNVLVIDPKGGEGLEVLNKMVDFLVEAKRLDDFLYINPFMPKATEYFNPLFNLSDDEIASLIASLLYPNEDTDSKFYCGYVETILKALLYSLSYLEAVADAQHTLRDKIIEEQLERYRMITMRYPIKKGVPFDLVKELDDRTPLLPETEIPIFNRSFITFRDILFYVDRQNLSTLAKAVEIMKSNDPETEMLRNQALLQVKKFLRLPDEFNEKISMSLTNFLSSLSTGVLGNMLCTIKINPIAMRLQNHNAGTIILMHPTPLKAKQTAEHLVQIVLKSIESLYGNVSLTGRAIHNKRLYLHLDEGESALYKGIQGVLNKGAGLGQTMFVYTQSVADLEHKLGATLAQVAKDSMNTIFVFKMNDASSKANVVRMFGTQVVMEHSVMHREEGGSATSFANAEKSFLTTSSIDRLEVGQCFFMNKNKKSKLFLPYVSDVDKTKGYIIADLQEEEKTTKILLDLESAFHQSREIK